MPSFPGPRAGRSLRVALFLWVLSVAAVGASGCSDSSSDRAEAPLDEEAFLDLFPSISTPLGCPPIFSDLELLDGRRTGKLRVSARDARLEVELRTVAPWLLRSVDLHAESRPVPRDEDGAVDAQKFLMNFPLGQPTSEFEVTLPVRDLATRSGDALRLSVHVDLQQSRSSGAQSVTIEGGAWAFSKASDGQVGRSRWTELPPCLAGLPEGERSCVGSSAWWASNQRYTLPPVGAGEARLSTLALFCGSAWVDILQPNEDASSWEHLAEQWIAARLNQASGAEAGLSNSLIERAALLLGGCELSEEEEEEASAITAQLVTWNEGEGRLTSCR